MNILSPSILAADFGRLEAHCREAAEAGVTWLHIDVMDGNFVPNISFGSVAVKALRPLADELGLTLDVHLMIENPEAFIEEFAEAGSDIITVHIEATKHIHRAIQQIKATGKKAGITLNPGTSLSAIEEFADAGSDIITVHIEATKHIHRAIQQIKATGKKAGITLNPGTSLSAIEELLPEVDLVLVMSVNPGFGGQSYIPASTDKIARLRKSLDAMGSDAYLEVDGGAKIHNVGEIINAGADVVVAGSAVFKGSKSVAENVADFHAIMHAE